MVGEQVCVVSAEVPTHAGSQTGQRCRACSVESEDVTGDVGVEPDEVVPADQMGCRALGTTTARGDHEGRRGHGPGSQTARVEALGVNGLLVDRADIEHPDRGEVHTEHADGLADRDHRGVVRPDSAVDKPVTIDQRRREVRRCRTSGHRHVDHRDLPVASETVVVRGLEDVHLAALHVPRRDNEPLLARTEDTVSEDLGQHVAQHTSGVHRADDPARSGQPGTDEDPLSQDGVLLDDLGRTHPGAERERHDPTSGGSRDQVELLGHPETKVLLQARKYMHCEQRLRAAAVQSQNLEPIRTRRQLGRRVACMAWLARHLVLRIVGSTTARTTVGRC